MISVEDSPFTYEYDNYFKILPTLNNWNKDLKRIKNGKLVEEDFVYSSNLNEEWMSKNELREWIKNQREIFINKIMSRKSTIFETISLSFLYFLERRK